MVPFLLPGSAGARGRSDIVALNAAPIPPPFKDGIASRAGLVIGHGRAADMVAFFTAHGFTNFRDVADAAQGDELTIGASIQPDAHGDTGHVQLLGIAAPDVARATLELRSGAMLDVELVKAGSAGYSFFTYVSDDPVTFPTVAHVFDPAGAERQREDLASAIAPPKNVS